MKITLPREIRIDLDNIPENLEEIVQKAFTDFTEGTDEKYRYQDKLYFIDLMIGRLHHADSDNINDLIKSRFAFDLDEYGELTEPEDFLSIEFMRECYDEGRKDSRLYSQTYTDDRHNNEKIMQVACRVIKAVMNYD